MRTMSRRSEAAWRGGSSRARAPAGGAPAGRGAPLRHKSQLTRAVSPPSMQISHSHTIKDLLSFRSIHFACRYLKCHCWSVWFVSLVNLAEPGSLESGSGGTTNLLVSGEPDLGPVLTFWGP
jgi:hypothetical protein